MTDIKDFDSRSNRLNLAVEVEQETDGRWIAEVTEIPGCLCYGTDQAEATSRVKALALRVLADRLEQGEAVPDLELISFVGAA